MSEIQKTENKENTITELQVVYDDNSTLFDKSKYIVPLYQRAFAWADKEIGQLIEDINDCESTVSHYYLGSLVVKEKNNKFEVIDGQQRLTALYLLLNYLKFPLPDKSLTYECRYNSNYTLEHLSDLLNKEKTELLKNNLDRVENSLLSGSQCISDAIRDKLNEHEFIEKLKKVRIYKIEVPKNTDLNRYFEIMNVRGEQLEQHDVLKAKLMSSLKTMQEKSQFAMIWDACSDMSGYVQMHFNTKNRELIFGAEWNSVPNIKSLSELSVSTDKTNKNQTLRSILESDKDITNSIDENYIDEDDNKIRFKSIVGFSHFLLHILKVFIVKFKLDVVDKPMSKQLDDTKLLEMFNAVLRDGTIAGVKIDKADFAENFIIFLLKSRFLFDKYIIKREYSINAREEENLDDDGVWSLKELMLASGKKPYYAATRLKKHIKSNTVKCLANENLMIQSCLRVSFTSQKVSHWITKLLSFLIDADYEDMTEYKDITEKIAQESVKDFLNDEKNFRRGVETTHLVFNYLDYLLWMERDNLKYKKHKFAEFKFEFRNSVEHWYPQHPNEENFAKWNDVDSFGRLVDRFGNLCLIQRKENSRFSNLSPHSKYDTYKKTIERASLKLRIMGEMTMDATEWRDKLCAEHEKEMLNLLRKACKIEIVL